MKINIKKGSVKVLLIIVVLLLIAVIAAAGYGFLEYKKVSGAIIKAGQLAGEERYNDAVGELELVSNNLILRVLSVERQEINQKIAENNQLLEDQTNYNEGIGEIKSKDWKDAEEALSRVSDKYPLYQDAKSRIDILKETFDCQYRKGEYMLRVFDSQGRVTGMVNGEVKEEIPNSTYSKESNTVDVFDSQGYYIHEFYAVKVGNYCFTNDAFRYGEMTQSYLENIPIVTGATHRILADVSAAETGNRKTILMIDDNSDGEFEKEIYFTQNLTCEEFIIKTKMPDINLYE
jgi:hypothetical protein